MLPAGVKIGEIVAETVDDARRKLVQSKQVPEWAVDKWAFEAQIEDKES